MAGIDHCIPPLARRPDGILGRHVHVTSPHVLRAYLEAYTQPGDLVVDPFGADPSFVRECLRAGRRAAHFCDNPLLGFFLRTSLTLRSPRPLTAAFARLAESPKVHTSLRVHLGQLYATHCPRCRGRVEARAFVWRRGASQPVAKSFHCPTCFPHDRRLRTAPVEESDLERLAEVDPDGYQLHWASQRLPPADRRMRRLHERLLALYTPRNLYALAALIVRLDELFAEDPLQDALRLIVLHCLDLGTKLHRASWIEDVEQEPNLASVPSRLAEINLWWALERGFELALGLAKQREAGEVSPLWAFSPEELRDEGGEERSAANVYCSALRFQIGGAALPPYSVKLIYSEQEPAQDTGLRWLCYLWQALLFGPETAAPFGEALLHPSPGPTRELSASLAAGRLALCRGQPIILHATTEDVRVNFRHLFSAGAAGYAAEQVLAQPAPANAPPHTSGGKRDRFRFTFHLLPRARRPTTEPPATRGRLSLERTAVQAAVEVLLKRGEPAPFASLYAAAAARLVAAGYGQEFQSAGGEHVAEGVRTMHQAVSEALASGCPHTLVQVWAGGECLWWLAQPSHAAPSLSDQVEWAVYNVLSTSGTASLENVASVISGLFKESLSPNPEALLPCLRSYADERTPGVWTLRPHEAFRRRLDQHSQRVADLVELGHRWGMQVWVGREEQKRRCGETTLGTLLTTAERFNGVRGICDSAEVADADVVWYRDGRLRHIFEVEWTAMLSDAVVKRGSAVAERDVQRLLVIPEERVGLVLWKLDRLPWLRKMFQEQGWDFIKFQNVRRLLEEDMTPATAFKVVGLEPLIEEYGQQLSLFD